MIQKFRDRPNRGPLQKFEDLPKEKQEVFRAIKKEICEVLQKDVEIGIFGSFSKGNWDEFSDYDVALKELIDPSLPPYLKDILGVKVDISSPSDMIGLIRIC